MNRRLVIRARARREMDEAFTWYSDRSKEVAADFVDALREGLIAVRDDPLRYPVIYKDKRRFLLRRFPYGLFYTIKPEEIIVLSCFHGRRNPARWRSRR